jgi:hypothetical protein
MKNVLQSNVYDFQSMHPVVCPKRTFKWGSQHSNNTQQDNIDTIISTFVLFVLFLMRHVSTFLFRSSLGNTQTNKSMNYVETLIWIHIYTINLYINMCHNYRLVQIMYVYTLSDIKFYVES